METLKTAFLLFMGIFIHLLLPAAGLVAYLRLIRRMRREQVPHLPKGSFFALFLIYGSVLMVILTGLCWEASGLSSLGILFLTFIAPVICALILLRHRTHTSLSKYHRIVRRLAIGYLAGETALISIIVTLFITNLVWLFFTGAL